MIRRLPCCLLLGTFSMMTVTVLQFWWRHLETPFSIQQLFFFLALFSEYALFTFQLDHILHYKFSLLFWTDCTAESDTLQRLCLLIWGCSSVVERSLCMWKAPGSIPGISRNFWPIYIFRFIFVLEGGAIDWGRPMNLGYASLSQMVHCVSELGSALDVLAKRSPPQYIHKLLCELTSKSVNTISGLFSYNFL